MPVDDREILDVSNFLINRDGQVLKLLIKVSLVKFLELNLKHSSQYFLSGDPSSCRDGSCGDVEETFHVHPSIPSGYW